MPKSKNKNKKRKTSQNHQGAGEDLSHAEIWDDSALLRSWDDALAEYEVSLQSQDLQENAFVLRDYGAKLDWAGIDGRGNSILRRREASFAGVFRGSHLAGCLGLLTACLGLR